MNKFVSYLEQFGLAVLRGFNIIPAVTTVLESSAGQAIPVLDKLSQVWSLVKQAEVMIGAVLGPGSGPKKAAAIAPLVAQVVMSSEIAAGKKVSPEKQAFFNDTCLRLGGVVADLGNCFVADVAEVPTDKAAPAPAPVAVITPRKIELVAFPAPAPAPVSHLEDPLITEHAPGVIAAMQAGAAGASNLPQD